MAYFLLGEGFEKLTFRVSLEMHGKVTAGNHPAELSRWENEGKCVLFLKYSQNMSEIFLKMKFSQIFSQYS